MTEDVDGGVLVELSNGLARAVERAAISVVTVAARRGYPASGIAWSDRIVVTADHVIEQEDEIVLGLPDGSRRGGTLAGRDPMSGVAVLRTEGGGLAAAERAAGLAPIGTLALAVARPGDGGPMASSGIVSGHTAIGRRRAGGSAAQVLRTDATFYPGFSGGALVDISGRVLGMCTSWGGRGMPAAIPADSVAGVVEALLTRGRLGRGYLGIGSQPARLTPSLRAQTAPDQETALLVVAVEPGTPADAAGLMVGDLVVAMDGEPVADTADLQAVLGPDSVGRSIGVRLLRGGQPVDLTVTPAERDEGRGR